MTNDANRALGRIRYNSGDPAGAPSGYEGEPVDDFSIPSCTIEDVDRGIMALFETAIEFNVTVRGKGLRKVPVIFATGERFAQLARNAPIRDKEGKLILPLISIKRSSIEQTSTDMTSRGINQHTGDLVIKRRLSPDDREYQKLVNKLGLVNQSNVAVKDGEPAPIGSYDETGALADSPRVINGALLSPDLLGNNVFEFITIPQPQFYTANYEVGFWTQYTSQMNEMIQRLMSSQLPQGRSFRIDTPKGYWFVANINEQKVAADNFGDFAQNERIVKVTFSLSVPAYLLAPDNHGDDVPFRRYTSMPRIRFDVYDFDTTNVSNDPLAEASDPANFSLTPDVERIGAKALHQRGKNAVIVENPFAGDGTTKYVRVVGENQKVGERVYRGKTITKLGSF